MSTKIEIFMVVAGCLIMVLMFHSCIVRTEAENKVYEEKRQACRKASLPMPYDSRHFPVQCICIEGIAK